MNNSIFTPGPWKKTNSAVYDQVETRDGRLICFASMLENSHANATLIAQAPKLLEALEEVLADYVSRPKIGITEIARRAIEIVHLAKDMQSSTEEGATA